MVVFIMRVYRTIGHAGWKFMNAIVSECRNHNNHSDRVLPKEYKKQPRASLSTIHEDL